MNRVKLCGAVLGKNAHITKRNPLFLFVYARAALKWCVGRHLVLEQLTDTSIRDIAVRPVSAAIGRMVIKSGASA